MTHSSGLGAFLARASAIVDAVADADARGYDPNATLCAEQFSALKTLVMANDMYLRDAAERDRAFILLAERARYLYARFYCHVEARACLTTIIAPTAAGRTAFTSNNDALAVTESRATGLGRDSTLAFVGCGSFPWSAVRYHALAGCHVTGVDHNSLAIHLAHETLEALGLGSAISLLEADARDVDYAPFSHVVVAGMASPKREICARVADTAPPGSQLVIRAARGLNRMFYEGYEPDPTAAVHAHLPSAHALGELESWIVPSGGQPARARGCAA